jgi:GH15 family glucan-1,4-alpha-glucosidase
LRSLVILSNAIADYAIIGDCRSAALISKDGALDWLCLPHFSSPTVFGGLLDQQRGGRFQIFPCVRAEVARRYLPNTNVLETTWRTSDGVVRLLDLMPIPSGIGLEPMAEVLRVVQGVEGTVPIRLEIQAEPDYGRLTPRLRQCSRSCWAWTWRDECLHLTADCIFQPSGPKLRAEHVVTAGQRLFCSLSYAKSDIGVIPGRGTEAERRLESTIRWWQEWCARARYDGPYSESVRRSVLTLKLLTYALSGAVVAAPSTSLPEAIGADRNWDYRYCWLRDAALTMRAFVRLGYLDEAGAFFGWMLHATRLTWPQLQVLYDVYGRTRLPETELSHWRGFCDSRPVRVGNGAYSQLQLDVYGAVCHAAREFVNATGELQRDEARLLKGFGEAVCRLWQEPDHGIWEVRGEPRHYTFSKVMCWTALDALLALSAKGMLKAPPEFETTRAALRDVIETRGYNNDVESYVGVLGGASVDASLLLMSCLDYRNPRDERLRSTYSRIQQRLSHNGLLFRYERGEDRIRAAEGAFGICSFWAIDNLAKRGDLDEARRSFEHMLGFANDLGLFAEEIDAQSGALLGNFPQAYTHVGLINAALALEAEGA